MGKELYSRTAARNMETASEMEEEAMDAEKEEVGVDAELERAVQLDEKTRALAAALGTKNAEDLVAAIEGMRRVIEGKDGGDVLQRYVLASPNCTELQAAWEAGPDSAVSVPLLRLLSAILRHPAGLVTVEDGDGGRDADEGKSGVRVRLRLDKLATSILRTRMKAMYSHLSSNKRSRQNAALILLTGIVFRSKVIAAELAKDFNFSLEALREMAKPPRLSAGKTMVQSQSSPLFQPTRVAFVDFAMSFLTMSDPGLLRWVLAQRPLYYGVLRFLARDDEKTVTYVLQLLQKKVVNPTAAVPSGILNSLFGDLALDQLAQIVVNEQYADAPKLAYQILVQLCTRSGHGLSTASTDVSKFVGTSSYGSRDSKVLKLLLQLKPTVFERHRTLLFTIASSTPKLAAAYLDSLPFSLQPRPSSSWFAAMSIVAELVPRASVPPPFSSLAAQGLCPALDGPLVQGTIHSLIPRALPRVALSKGLQHANVLVIQACLKVILVALQSAELLLRGILEAADLCGVTPVTGKAGDGITKSLSEAGCKNELDDIQRHEVFHNTFLKLESTSRSCGAIQPYQTAVNSKHEVSVTSDYWYGFARHVQDSLCALLPDPQLLIRLLHPKEGVMAVSKKRKLQADSEAARSKKQRVEKVSTEGDTGGNPGLGMDDSSDEEDLIDYLKVEDLLPDASELLHREGLRNAKVLEVLGAYQRVLPVSLADNRFDAFKLLPEDPSSLLPAQQRALLGLLLSATDHDFNNSAGTKRRLWLDMPKSGPIFKHVRSLLRLMISTDLDHIRKQARELASRAMISTGAFDSTSHEVSLLLDFIPLKPMTCVNPDPRKRAGVACFQSLYSEAVVAFLSDAIWSIGLNIYQYLDQLHTLLAADPLLDRAKSSTLQNGRDHDLGVWGFGPFVLCLLNTWRSKAAKPPQLAVLASYVAAVLLNLLMSQANPQPLAVLIKSTLRPEDCLASHSVEASNLREWTPLVYLLSTVQDVVSKTNSTKPELHVSSTEFSKLFAGEGEGIAKQDASVLADHGLRATPEEIVGVLPELVQTLIMHFQADFSILIFQTSVYKHLLHEIADRWTDIFENAVGLIGSDGRATKLEDIDLATHPSVATGIAHLMRLLPFHILFPAIAHSRRLLSLMPLKNLLYDTISHLAPSRWLFSANLILFQIGTVSSFDRSAEEFGQLHTYFSLLRHMIFQLDPSDLTGSVDDEHYRITCYGNMISGVLAHPVFQQFLTPRVPKSLLAVKIAKFDKLLDEKKDLGGVNGMNELCMQLASSRRSMLVGDYLLLEFLQELLKHSQLLHSKSRSKSARPLLHNLHKRILSSSQPHISSSVAALRTQLSDIEGLKKLSGSPLLYVLSALLPYVESSILVDVLFNLLSGIGQSSLELDHSLDSLTFLLSIIILNALSSVYSQRPNEINLQTIQGDGFEECKSEKVAHVLEALAETVIRAGSELGDCCLLAALQALQGSHDSVVFSPESKSPELPRLTHLTSFIPVDVLWYCVKQPTRTKASIMDYLIQSSPVHLVEFGRAMAYATSEKEHRVSEDTNMETAAALMRTGLADLKIVPLLSEESLLLFLSPALKYVSSQVEEGQPSKTGMVAQHIAHVYGKVICDAIKKWDSSKFLKDVASSEDCDSACEMNMDRIYFSSTVAKAVRMLELCMTLDTTCGGEKQSLRCALLTSNKNLLRTLANPEVCHSESKLQQTAIEIVARVGLLQTLTAPGCRNESSGTGGVASNGVSEKQVLKKGGKSNGQVLKYVNFLVDSINVLLTQQKDKRVDQSFSSSWMFYMEQRLMGHLLDAAGWVEAPSRDSHYLSLIKAVFTVVLKHRFAEVSSMKALRSLSASLLQGAGGQPSDAVAHLGAELLDLVVSHSQFLPCLICGETETALPTQFRGRYTRGTFLSSLPFLLALVETPTQDRDEPSRPSKASLRNTKLGNQGWENLSHVTSGQSAHARLEMVRLLRVLFALKMHPSNVLKVEGDTVMFHDVLSLLLAVYGATMSPVDQEIFNLMHEVEEYGGAGFSGLAGMDYSWGEAAGKRRKLQADGREPSSLETIGGEDAKFEFSKRIFKEDMAIDPKSCGLTVWCFPVERKIWTAGTGGAILETLTDVQAGLLELRSDVPSYCMGEAAYDPAFILPFCLNALSKGYMVAEEVVRLGLLAICLASISSADDGMRKLGYEVLMKFTEILEAGPSFKGSQQIHVLLTSVKNAITEPWQRIPFVSAVFAAEASCVLMHPESLHYLTVNRCLLQRPSLDLEHIPLLHTMLSSGEAQYRSDRAWILRLLAAGLVSSLDAQIYRRKFVPEILMSLYSSPLSDLFTSKWVLEVLRKASRIPSSARHLVEHLGVLSWLSSAAISSSDLYLRGQEQQFHDIPTKCLEVLENVLRWKRVRDFGASEGFDELLKVALQMHWHITNKLENPQQVGVFKRPTIRILALVINLGQRRKKHQTRFTMSLKFLAEIIDWVEKDDVDGGDSREETRMQALLLLLQSRPPPTLGDEDMVMLLEVMRWAVRIALRRSPSNKCSPVSKGEWDKESIPHKLLRWISASLVLGQHSKTAFPAGTYNNFWCLCSNCGCYISSTATCSELTGLLVMLHGHAVAESSTVSAEYIVDALVMLLCSKGIFQSASGMTGILWQSQAIQQTLELILKDLPCPAEVAPSWNWSFFGQRRSDYGSDTESHDVDVQLAYVGKLRNILLVICQQLLAGGSMAFEGCVIERWKKGLEANHPATFSRCELQQKVNAFRTKLIAALAPATGEKQRVNCRS